MKKIISPGKKEFIATCTHCGCKFSYELSDISINSVSCPECDNYVCHVDQSKLPDNEENTDTSDRTNDGWEGVKACFSCRWCIPGLTSSTSIDDLICARTGRRILSKYGTVCSMYKPLIKD